MKKIINGKRYDTDTATDVASYHNGYYSHDFKRIDETLYLTPRGRWFLIGEGGPLSKYAQPCGNNGMCGGEGVFPLTPEEAKDWLERHDENEMLEKYFADKIEDA